jgi:hypothetical protein
MWPQCWDSQGPRGLEQRDLRNLNLGDLKKGPNGGVSPTPQKKGTPIIKKPNPSLLSKKEQRKKKKKTTEVLTLNKYMAMGPSGARCQE